LVDVVDVIVDDCRVILRWGINVVLLYADLLSERSGSVIILQTGLITVKQSDLWQCNVDLIDDYCKMYIACLSENFSPDSLFGGSA
jgi:hypothetical protein